MLDQGLIRVAVVAGQAGTPVVDERVPEVLAEEEGKSLQGDLLRAAFPDLAAFVDPGIREAMRAAGQQLQGLQARAAKALEVEKSRALQRLERALKYQGLDAAAIAEQLAAERRHHDKLTEALAGLTLQLDSVCGFVLAR